MALADTLHEIENSAIEPSEYLTEDSHPLVRRAIDESQAFFNGDRTPCIPALNGLGWPVFYDVHPESGDEFALIQTAKGYLVVN